MKKLLIIVGDCNDADYSTSAHLLDTDDIDDVELLKLLPKISNALNDCKDSHNWPNSKFFKISVRELYDGILTKKDIDIFEQFIPFGEHRIHSIEEISVYDINDFITYF